MSARFLALGQFVTPFETQIPWQQAYFECERSDAGIQRVLTFSTKALTAAKPSGTWTESYYSHDTTGSRPADLSWTQSEPGVGVLNEQHVFGGRWPAKRFIIRPPGDIHCSAHYQTVVGGCAQTGPCDNPNLGLWGRVWVLDSTDVPEESELPSTWPSLQQPA